MTGTVRNLEGAGDVIDEQTRIACAGILFDSDGVLVDSDASVAAAWSRWAQE